MVVQVYVVLISDETPEDLRKRVVDLMNEQFKQVRSFSDRVHFVRIPMQENITAADLAERIEMRGEHRSPGTTGVTIRLSPFYAGYGDTTLGEWLKDGFAEREDE